MKVAFYIGYSRLNGDIYGSEIALLKLATELGRICQVYIIYNEKCDKKCDNVSFITEIQYSAMNFDVTIVSRYVNFFIILPVRSPKVYIWIHDVGVQSSYNFKYMPAEGYNILDNVKHDELICLTYWQASFVMSRSVGTIGHADIEIIGNGITTSNFVNMPPRVPYRFIWTSSPFRGLSYLIKIFPIIKDKYPLSELHIFRGPDDFTPEQFESIYALDYIFYHGGLENSKMADEFMKSSVWLYPTNFDETYCISALEAQASGCLCICSNRAALCEVVCERGIILNSIYDTDELTNEIMEALDKGFSNFEYYSTIAREWGMKQDWKNRAFSWYKLIRDNTKMCSVPYQAYVINLDERTDRMDNIKELLIDIQYERFSAIEGKKLSSDDERLNILRKNNEYPVKNPYMPHNMAAGAIGCTLSHLHMWNEAVNYKGITVVFEDDLVLCDNFVKKFDTLLNYLINNQEWDVCFMGYLDDVPIYNDTILTELNEFNIYEFNKVIARRNGGGSHSYCINKRGATKLLKLANQYGIPQTIDWFMIEMFPYTNCIKCMPHLVEQNNSPSDIKNNLVYL